MACRKLAIANSFTTNKIMPDMKVEGFLMVTTEEESRKGDMDRAQRGEEEADKVKSNIFKKNE